MAYWVVSRLAPKHEALALHCLALAGYEVYLPRLRERRVIRHREIEITPPGLSKLLAMHDHDARVDVLLKAVRLAAPGARPVIRPNCF